MHHLALNFLVILIPLAWASHFAKWNDRITFIRQCHSTVMLYV